MKKILFLFMAVSLFVGCSNSDTDEVDVTNQTIEISEEAVSFGVVGGEKEVAIKSSGNWRVVGRKAWCTPSVDSGKSGDMVTFTATRNVSEEDRSEVFSFVCGSKVVKMTISQQGNNLLIIPQKNYKASADGEELSVKIKATVPITYEISEEGRSWITNTTITPPTTDGANSFLKFRVATNRSYGDRTATIKFVYGEGLEEVITIAQPQNDAIVFDKSVYELDENGGSIKIKVQANVDYSVVVADADKSWITYNGLVEETRALISTEHSFTITVAEKAARISDIHFISNNGKVDAKVTIKQSGQPTPPLVIPDDKFRSWLSKNGYINVTNGTNCEITEKGLAATNMDIQNAGLKDLTGISAFVGLTTVKVQNNLIEKLDLTGCVNLNSLVCYNNNLSKVIIDNQAPLEKLEIIGLRNTNYVTSYAITIVGAKIQNIDVSYNTTLSYIDVSECPGLTTLDCTYNSRSAVLWLKTGQTIPNLYKDSTATISYR